MPPPSVLRATVLTTIALLLTASTVLPADFEHDPIRYSQSTPKNAITRLQEQLDQGQVRLTYDAKYGYLPAVLATLKVPVSSQGLVFSKTSLQRQRIAPKTPRAIYFNDDIYIGYCQHGDLLEVSTADPQLGAVFYTLSQDESVQPVFKRQTDNCLICHESSHTHGFPGHIVRSVFSDAGGFPILSAGTYRIDQTSPIRQRWGGWYVTGKHGSQTHLGNLVIRDANKTDPATADNLAGQNVTDLSPLLKTSAYLTPHSDIVALMVLEHQTQAQNYLTRANFETRLALHYEAALNRELKQPAGHRWDSTRSRIKSVGEPLVKYLLFSGEAELTAPIKGSPDFERDFAANTIKDRLGRSLRDFNLERRMFQFPCSYLIYSASFDALPDEIRNYVYQRLWDVLSGKETSKDFAHLSALDRQAIVEILRETKRGLPDYWKVSAE